MDNRLYILKTKAPSFVTGSEYSESYEYRVGVTDEIESITKFVEDYETDPWVGSRIMLRVFGYSTIYKNYHGALSFAKEEAKRLSIPEYNIDLISSTTNKDLEFPELNHSQCQFSHTHEGSISAGQGRIDENGYFEYPCFDCAYDAEYNQGLQEIARETQAQQRETFVVKIQIPKGFEFEDTEQLGEEFCVHFRKTE